MQLVGDCQVEEAGLSEMGWKAVAADADGVTLTDEMSWGRWWMTDMRFMCFHVVRFI